MSNKSDNNALDDSQPSGPKIFHENEEKREITNGNLHKSLHDLEKEQSQVTDGNKGGVK